jgi:hypothetical protein
VSRYGWTDVEASAIDLSTGGVEPQRFRKISGNLSPKTQVGGRECSRFEKLGSTQ